jgi:hypothetical protein
MRKEKSILLSAFSIYLVGIAPAWSESVHKPRSTGDTCVAELQNARKVRKDGFIEVKIPSMLNDNTKSSAIAYIAYGNKDFAPYVEEYLSRVETNLFEDAAMGMNPRAAGAAVFRRLPWPSYVPTDLALPGFRWRAPFRWSQGLPKGPYRGLPRGLEVTVRKKLNGGPLTGFGLATTEWIVLAMFPGLSASKRKQAWKIMEWAWLRNLGGLHPARTCDSPPLHLAKWRGNRCEIATGQALKAQLLAGGREKFVALQALAAHVFGDVDAFATWRRAIVDRLLQFPAERLVAPDHKGDCHYYTRGGTVFCHYVGQVNEDFPPKVPGEYWVSFQVSREALDPTLPCDPAEFPAARRRLMRRLRTR